jgi:hypothetical protein
MTRARTAARCLALLGISAAVAACGPTPPQAPSDQAKKLSVATGGISTACGLAYQLTGFPGDHRAGLETLEATATSSAEKLAAVYHRNPAWIYQGETVHDIVRDSLSMLGGCGLTKAQNALAQATYARRDS